MTTTALHPFIEAAERDAALFNVAQLAASRVRWWLGTALQVVAFPVFLLLAQFAPFMIRRHVALVVPHLPNVTNRADLAWVKDALTLYHEAMVAYAPFCLFRREAASVLEELDEQLDSLEFVAAHDAFLQETVAQIDTQTEQTDTYRKRKGNDTWHFCSNCSTWPTTNYDKKPSKPTTGEFCNECLAKKQANNCRSSGEERNVHIWR